MQGVSDSSQTCVGTYHDRIRFEISIHISIGLIRLGPTKFLAKVERKSDVDIIYHDLLKYNLAPTLSKCRPRNEIESYPPRKHARTTKSSSANSIHLYKTHAQPIAAYMSSASRTCATISSSKSELSSMTPDYVWARRRLCKLRLAVTQRQRVCLGYIS